MKMAGMIEMGTDYAIIGKRINIEYPVYCPKCMAEVQYFNHDPAEIYEGMESVLYCPDCGLEFTIDSEGLLETIMMEQGEFV